jgi:hypothetical protein
MELQINEKLLEGFQNLGKLLGIKGMTRVESNPQFFCNIWIFKVEVHLYLNNSLRITGRHVTVQILVKQCGKIFLKISEEEYLVR